MMPNVDIHEWLFEKYESRYKFLRNTHGKSDCYEYIAVSLSTLDNLKMECIELFGEDISSSRLIMIIDNMIDYEVLFDTWREYFGYDAIELCDECETWWMSDGDEEEECHCCDESTASDEEPVQTVEPVEESSEDPSDTEK